MATYLISTKQLTEATIMTQAEAVDAACARIQADGEAQAILRDADKAREVTVTANLHRNDGSIDRVTAVGIAPFEAVKTVGCWTGSPGWTVAGQPYASKSGVRSTVIKSSDRMRFGIGLLSMGEAAELARDLNLAAE